MAVRRGCRVSLLSPAKVSCESRGRLTMLAPGSSFSTIGRMVAAPSTSVSSRPRRLSMRSVKTWPRSRSAPSCTSSIATKAVIEIARHRLDRRHPEARVRRLDLLFAGDERDVLRADPVDDLVVDLARQQPQRQADHAGGMRQHPLDGEMGLAGVGRPEHGGDAGAAIAGAARRGRRERDGHQCPIRGNARSPIFFSLRHDLFGKSVSTFPDHALSGLGSGPQWRRDGLLYHNASQCDP